MQSVKLQCGICSNLDRINRNFLWGHMEEKKVVHLIKWDTVCKPKSKGGLGLKKMNNLNQSLLAKAGWRMIQPGAGLWSSLLHNKYFKNGRLGDGKSINFWTERWLPDLGSLEAHACIQLNEDKLKEKVCCYFDKGNWDIHKLRAVVPEALVQRIICVYANGNVNKHDKLIWGLSNGGNFTVKSAYDLQCGVAEVTKWDWNFIWRLKLPPKITHFLWLLLHGRLLTNVHRCSRGLDDVATCPRCNISNEDLNHLLRDCNYSINIWRNIWGCGRASTLLKGDLNTWLRCNLKDKSCSDNMIPNFLLFASTLHIVLESDSLSAIKLLHQDNIDNHPLFNLILSCKDFIRRQWDYVITHGFRESNRVADGLAFLGKNMVAGINYYEAPPSQIARLFLDDLCGIPTMRIVSL
ncbi:hypothetical protein ACOSQ3_016447 [Xanthoceras sorbifolium]